ncbi:hypothetical protein CMI37_24575 [Candidatus Pacearchaeota archaeon]|nr:hypothetical protein [Candidatus Pacearchaeota archaeon]
MQDNKQYIDSKNYKEPSLLDAFKIPDTEVEVVGGEVSEVNLGEALVLDEIRRFGLVEPEEEGNLLKAMGGSGDINPESGRRRYQMEADPSMMMSMLQTGKDMGTAAGETGAAGGGVKKMAFAAANAAVPGLGTALMVGDMLYGAHKQGEANKAKMQKISEGIDKINAKRTQLGERAVKDINNIWEGVGNKLSEIRAGAGNTLENLSDKAADVVKRGKGLATGDAEQMVSKTTTNVQESLSQSTKSLEHTAGTQVDAYGRKMEDETGSMTMEIQDMQEDIDELSKKDTMLENIL